MKRTLKVKTASKMKTKYVRDIIFSYWEKKWGSDKIGIYYKKMLSERSQHSAGARIEPRIARRKF